MASLRGVIIRKLHNQAGESIAETLVAVLIAAFALIMLAGALTASSGVVDKSRDKLNEYYSANETSSGVVYKMSGGSSISGGMTITSTSNISTSQSFNITYYQNGEFSQAPVYAYERDSD